MGDHGRSALHPLEGFPGLDHDVAESLVTYGIGSVEELASLKGPQARAVAAVVDGLSESHMIGRLCPAARFHLLGPDGSEAAQVLVEGGVATYLELFAAPTKRICTLTGWTTERALQLQLEAARAALIFRVLVRVIDGNDQPIGLPRLEVVDAGLANRRPVVIVEGDELGWVLSPPLRRDRVHHLSLVAGAHRRSLWVRPQVPQVHRLVLRLAAPPSSSPVRDHRRPVVLSGRLTMTKEKVPLSDVPDGEAFRVGREEAGRVSLNGLNRALHGMTVITWSSSVLPVELPDGVAEGDVVIVKSEKLRKAKPAEKRRAQISRGGDLVKVFKP